MPLRRRSIQWQSFDVTRLPKSQRQGWSIWAFVAIFAALGIVGLFVAIVIGSPSGDSVGAPTATTAHRDPATSAEASPAARPSSTSTLPPNTTAASTNGRGSSTTATGSSNTPVTLPGGAPAPEGATSVVSTSDALNLGFNVDVAALGPSPEAIVPPLHLQALEDGRSIQVSIGCARSNSEQLAQLALTESASVVTVSAVVLVAPSMPPCGSDGPLHSVVLPLHQPLGTRSLMTVSAATKLPNVELPTSPGG